jgi:hypothetical protein
MTRIPTSYFALGALYLIVGLSLGIGMGIAHDFRFAPVHAHINLLGWVTHALMGLAYRQWPDLQKSNLATAQFAIFGVSTPIFLAGLVVAFGFDQPLLAILGSLGVFVGAILFAFMAARLWMVGERATA